jgi:hypothetical protein
MTGSFPEQRIEIEGDLIVREINYEQDAILICPADGDLDDADDLEDLIREHLTPVQRSEPDDDGHPPAEGYPLVSYGRYRLVLERCS